MATFNTRIMLKLDTFAKWTENNPVLLAGEVALVNIPADSSTGMNEPALMMKVGDGTKNFNSLPWASALAGDVIPSLKGSNPTLPATSITGLEEFIQGEIQDTDTQYQIVKNGNMGFKLQSKPKSGGEWTDVNEITLTAPTYSLLTGDTNGTVKFGVTGSEKAVPVAGLKSAAYTESSAYDAAGSAAAVQTALIGTAQDPSSANTINAAKKFATEGIDTAIGTLNLNAVTAGTGQVIGQIAQTDGAVTAQVKTLTAEDIPQIPQSKVENLTTTLAGKQDTVSFDQEYNSTTNKAATVATVTGAVNAAKAELIGTSDDASNLNTINAAKKYASEQIAAQIGSVYKAAGSIAFADLPTPEKAIEGYVYNVTDAFTADTKFITSEQSKQYPAGTNVVVVEVPGVEEAPPTYAYDVLTGMVDLSDFATTTAMTSAIDAAKTELIGTGNTIASTIKGAGDEAKAYTDTLNTAMDTRVEALETAVGETPVATQITNAIGALDVADTAVAGQFVNQVVENDGKITVSRAALKATDIPNLTASKITDLDTTISGAIDEAIAADGAIDEAISGAVTEAIAGVAGSATGTEHQFLTSVTLTNGVLTGSAAQPAVADINGLQTALDAKANTDDLATVATTGKIDDLTQTATVIFNCGSSVV